MVTVMANHSASIITVLKGLNKNSSIFAHRVNLPWFEYVFLQNIKFDFLNNQNAEIRFCCVDVSN